MNKNKEIKWQFEELRVWQQAMDLAQLVYQQTQSFPKLEQYGLQSQLQRAVTSIVLNIAEGKGRYHNKEFIQFLYLSRGSLYETVTCLQLAVRLNYLQQSEIETTLNQAQVIHSQLNSLIKSMKTTESG
ncbi:MAG: hypothetical protein COX77_03210 [Candidatus Komeilibacteria bacterium CG_4_10_14_0_2_um_filter_37_10]|uniref:Four helix bundle protein n=1 Tax=Candidatus Komeilibacteria bacterium CG_4_10_14_0_2_um_filter_37_10 TaxID=1974470 RepID=A0A2M7VED2_9BACT|nr:MAG: hypothetical protein COX77_03210 [Candidatus Komeilibacteria bacterium CG_4_10_14_0_2_um_filter_37_10]